MKLYIILTLLVILATIPILAPAHAESVPSNSNPISSSSVWTVYANGTVVMPNGTTVVDPNPLSFAVNYAQPGDTIILKNGTYTESVTIDKPLTLIGDGMPVLLNGSSTYSLYILNSASSVNLIGLDILAPMQGGTLNNLTIKDGILGVTANFYRIANLTIVNTTLGSQYLPLPSLLTSFIYASGSIDHVLLEHVYTYNLTGYAVIWTTRLNGSIEIVDSNINATTVLHAIYMLGNAVVSVVNSNITSQSNGFEGYTGPSDTLNITIVNSTVNSGGRAFRFNNAYNVSILVLDSVLQADSDVFTIASSKTINIANTVLSTGGTTFYISHPDGPIVIHKSNIVGKYIIYTSYPYSYTPILINHSTINSTLTNDSKILSVQGTTSIPLNFTVLDSTLATSSGLYVSGSPIYIFIANSTLSSEENFLGAYGGAPSISVYNSSLTAVGTAFQVGSHISTLSFTNSFAFVSSILKIVSGGDNLSITIENSTITSSGNMFFLSFGEERHVSLEIMESQLYSNLSLVYESDYNVLLDYVLIIGSEIETNYTSIYELGGLGQVSIVNSTVSVNSSFIYIYRLINSLYINISGSSIKANYLSKMSFTNGSNPFVISIQTSNLTFNYSLFSATGNGRPTGLFITNTNISSNSDLISAPSISGQTIIVDSNITSGGSILYASRYPANLTLEIYNSTITASGSVYYITVYSENENYVNATIDSSIINVSGRLILANNIPNITITNSEILTGAYTIYARYGIGTVTVSETTILSSKGFMRILHLSYDTNISINHSNILLDGSLTNTTSTDTYKLILQINNSNITAQKNIVSSQEVWSVIITNSTIQIGEYLISSSDLGPQALRLCYSTVTARGLIHASYLEGNTNITIQSSMVYTGDDTISIGETGSYDVYLLFNDSLVESNSSILYITGYTINAGVLSGFTILSSQLKSGEDMFYARLIRGTYNITGSRLESNSSILTASGQSSSFTVDITGSELYALSYIMFITNSYSSPGFNLSVSFSDITAGAGIVRAYKNGDSSTLSFVEVNVTVGQVAVNLTRMSGALLVYNSTVNVGGSMIEVDRLTSQALIMVSQTNIVAGEHLFYMWGSSGYGPNITILGSTILSGRDMISSTKLHFLYTNNSTLTSNSSIVALEKKFGSLNPTINFKDSKISAGEDVVQANNPSSGFQVNVADCQLMANGSFFSASTTSLYTITFSIENVQITVGGTVFSLNYSSATINVSGSNISAGTSILWASSFDGMINIQGSNLSSGDTGFNVSFINDLSTITLAYSRLESSGSHLVYMGGGLPLTILVNNSVLSAARTVFHSGLIKNLTIYSSEVAGDSILEAGDAGGYMLFLNSTVSAYSSVMSIQSLNDDLYLQVSSSTITSNGSGFNIYSSNGYPAYVTFDTSSIATDTVLMTVDRLSDTTIVESNLTAGSAGLNISTLSDTLTMNDDRIDVNGTWIVISGLQDDSMVYLSESTISAGGLLELSPGSSYMFNVSINMSLISSSGNAIKLEGAHVNVLLVDSEIVSGGEALILSNVWGYIIFQNSNVSSQDTMISIPTLSGELCIQAYHSTLDTGIGIINSSDNVHLVEFMALNSNITALGDVFSGLLSSNITIVNSTLSAGSNLFTLTQLSGEMYIWDSQLEAGATMAFLGGVSSGARLTMGYSSIHVGHDLIKVNATSSLPLTVVINNSVVDSTFGGILAGGSIDNLYVYSSNLTSGGEGIYAGLLNRDIKIWNSTITVVGDLISLSQTSSTSNIEISDSTLSVSGNVIRINLSSSDITLESSIIESNGSLVWLGNTQLPTDIAVYHSEIHTLNPNSPSIYANSSTYTVSINITLSNMTSLGDLLDLTISGYTLISNSTINTGDSILEASALEGSLTIYYSQLVAHGNILVAGNIATESSLVFWRATVNTNGSLALVMNSSPSTLSVTIAGSEIIAADSLLDGNLTLKHLSVINSTVSAGGNGFKAGEWVDGTVMFYNSDITVLAGGLLDLRTASGTRTVNITSSNLTVAGNVIDIGGGNYTLTLLVVDTTITSNGSISDASAIQNMLINEANVTSRTLVMANEFSGSLNIESSTIKTDGDLIACSESLFTSFLITDSIITSQGILVNSSSISGTFAIESSSIEAKMLIYSLNTSASLTVSLQNLNFSGEDPYVIDVGGGGWTSITLSNTSISSVASVFRVGWIQGFTVEESILDAHGDILEADRISGTIQIAYSIVSANGSIIRSTNLSGFTSLEIHDTNISVDADLLSITSLEQGYLTATINQSTLTLGGTVLVTPVLDRLTFANTTLTAKGIAKVGTASGEITIQNSYVTSTETLIEIDSINDTLSLNIGSSQVSTRNLLVSHGNNSTVNTTIQNSNITSTGDPLFDVAGTFNLVLVSSNITVTGRVVSAGTIHLVSIRYSMVYSGDDVFQASTAGTLLSITGSIITTSGTVYEVTETNDDVILLVDSSNVEAWGLFDSPNGTISNATILTSNITVNTSVFSVGVLGSLSVQISNIHAGDILVNATIVSGEVRIDQSTIEAGISMVSALNVSDVTLFEIQFSNVSIGGPGSAVITIPGSGGSMKLHVVNSTLYSQGDGFTAPLLAEATIVDSNLDIGGTTLDAGIDGQVYVIASIINSSSLARLVIESEGSGISIKSSQVYTIEPMIILEDWDNHLAIVSLENSTLETQGYLIVSQSVVANISIDNTDISAAGIAEFNNSLGLNVSLNNATVTTPDMLLNIKGGSGNIFLAIVDSNVSSTMMNINTSAIVNIILDNTYYAIDSNSIIANATVLDMRNTILPEGPPRDISVLGTLLVNITSSFLGHWTGPWLQDGSRVLYPGEGLQIKASAISIARLEFLDAPGGNPVEWMTYAASTYSVTFGNIEVSGNGEVGLIVFPNPPFGCQPPASGNTTIFIAATALGGRASVSITGNSTTLITVYKLIRSTTCWELAGNGSSINLDDLPSGTGLFIVYSFLPQNITNQTNQTTGGGNATQPGGNVTQPGGGGNQTNQTSPTPTPGPGNVSNATTPTPGAGRNETGLGGGGRGISAWLVAAIGVLVVAGIVVAIMVRRRV